MASTGAHEECASRAWRLVNIVKGIHLVLEPPVQFSKFSIFKKLANRHDVYYNIVQHLANTRFTAVNMLFESKLPCPPRPSSDAFNYIFHLGRRSYSRDRVIYRVNQTDITLTLAELEDKSRRFANSLVTDYDIRPNDVVAIFAKDKVRFRQS